MSRRHKIKIKRNLKTFWIVSMSGIFCLLAAAILQLNDYIHQNSLLRDYEKQLAALSVDSDKLEVKLSTKNSLENFNKDVMEQAANFEKVEVEKIKYIKASGEQLARR
jgi:valyl-tRNA synthetase